MDESDLPPSSELRVTPRFGNGLTCTPAVLLPTWRGSVKRGQREQVLPSPSARRLAHTCVGQVFIERDDDGRGSVGYWLLEDARGEGRAARAVRLMASWALPEMRLGRLQLHTDPENVASQRVAESAGFTREGVFRAYDGRVDGTPPMLSCTRCFRRTWRPGVSPILLQAWASAAIDDDLAVPVRPMSDVRAVAFFDATLLAPRPAG